MECVVLSFVMHVSFDAFSDVSFCLLIRFKFGSLLQMCEILVTRFWEAVGIFCFVLQGLFVY